jgi:hypothetical protein
MSVMESLHRVDEADLNRWIERASAMELDQVRREAFTAARADDSSAVREWVQDHLNDDGDGPSDVGDLLMQLHAKQSWHLGNALGASANTLSLALSLVPALQPLTRALEGRSRELGRLKRIAHGLNVVVDAPTAKALLPLLNGWTTREEVAARVAEVRLSWVAKLLGRQQALTAWTNDDLVWERWRSLCKSISAVSQGGVLVWETEV